MKLKIVLLAATLSLTGCATTYGPLVNEHEVGQISYKGGTGLDYQRATSQVSRDSITAGERYLEERKANDPLQAAINKSVKAGNEFEEKHAAQVKAQNKCAFVVEAHEQVLVNNALRNTSSATISALEDYRSGGKIVAFNKCMKNANL